MCMADYGGDRPDVYQRTYYHARKPWRCDECARPIEIGQFYQRAFMVYEGLPSTFRTCEHCLTGQRWLIENCGGFLHGAVWDDLEEHIHEYPRLFFSLSKLKIARRRKWQRFDRTGLMAVMSVPPSLQQVGLE